MDVRQILDKLGYKETEIETILKKLVIERKKVPIWASGT